MMKLERIVWMTIWTLLGCVLVPKSKAAFVTVQQPPHYRDGLATFPKVASSTATGRSSTTRLFGDGNPPPFGSWGQPASPPVPSPPPVAAPAQPPSSSAWTPSWYTPPPAATPPAASPPPPESPVAPPPSTWGMPAAAAAPPASSYTSSYDMATPPPPPPPAATTTPAVATPSASNAVGDAIAVFLASQEAAVQTIAAAIPTLERKPELSWAPGEAMIGSQPCTLDARDAPGPANIAWLASVGIPQRLASLTIFNGPLTDVPHLLSRVVVDDSTGQLQVAVDFRPRAYGAYETVDAHGNYPGPEELGRKAFEYSGARMDFFNKFAVSELQGQLTQLSKSLENAVPTSLQPSELDLLTGSPVAIDLTMPVTAHNVEVVTQLRDLAVQSWLGWVTDPQGTHDHRPGAPINTQYVYDAKFRQNSYLALRHYYSDTLGPADGATLAAAESGPLDEAYVGGGS